MKKVLIIFGSSRTDGNTMRIVKEFSGSHKPELINLRKQNISYFDYKHRNKDDSFLPIVKKMLQADRIVFATPVYWYAMSGYLKVFFDRFTDLLQVWKDFGRRLKGKSCFLLVSSTDPKLPGGFEIPKGAPSWRLLFLLIVLLE